MTTSTQCQHRALQSGCVLCKDARIAELETELTLRGEAIAVLNKALANDSRIVAQWQAQCVTAQEQIKVLRKALEAVQECFQRTGSWPPSITVKIRTALASTAPEQKEGE